MLGLGGDCALVYNPQGASKHPKLVVYIPSLFESGGDDSPHFVMMAVIANMILDKDPEFEALIAQKVSHYIASFEKKKERRKRDRRYPENCPPTSERHHRRAGSRLKKGSSVPAV
jgi:hypothetical protein